MPPELDAAIQTNHEAAATFASMTTSQKAEFVGWIVSAKQASTKASRVAKAVELLKAGKKRIR